jgi:peptidoglycan-associated lipoprotein
MNHHPKGSLLIVLLSLLLAAGPACTHKPKPALTPANPPAPTGEATPPPTPQPQTPPPAPETKLELKDIFFDYDKFNLRTDTQTILSDDGKVLTDNPQTKVLLEGHCDERGTVEYNLALGQKRADAVKSYFIQYGVDPFRLSTISYGEERPFVQGHDENAWSQNRRVHLVKQ